MAQKSPYTVRYTVGQVCDLLEVELPEQYRHLEHELPTRLSYSTNYLSAGSAFFLDGNKEQRKTRLAKAIEERAMIVFTNSTVEELPDLAQLPHIHVDNVADAVVTLAKAMRAVHGHKIVGITGSLGKTTTKELVYAVLSRKYAARKSPGNLNGHRPMFELLQKIPHGTELFVQEFGAGLFPGMLAASTRLCKPDAAIITCIAHNHLDVFGTQENILKDKSKLITLMDPGCPAFLNYDDPLLRAFRSPAHTMIYFSAAGNHEADYYADSLEMFEDYMTFDIVHGETRIPVRLNAHGAHNVGNALVAAAVGQWFGVSDQQIAAGIASYKSQGYRQNMVNIGGYRLYVDCFNAAPLSILSGIEVLENMAVEEGGKRIAVLSEANHLGDQDIPVHLDLGKKIGRSKVDLVLCMGNDTAKLMADAIRKEGKAVLYTARREQLNEWMRGLITKKDITLVKGSLPRILTKSIDQVFGSCLHITQYHYEWKTQGDWRFKLHLEEGENFCKDTASLMQYQGCSSMLELPAACGDVDVYCVGPNCFFKDVDLRRVTIPAPIAHVCAGAFRGCLKLAEVTLPATLTGIGDKAFRYCSSLTKLELPEGVMDIGEEAFACCRRLKSINLPESVGHIGDNAFADCPRVTVRCVEGSYAHSYVLEHKIPFELVTQ